MNKNEELFRIHIQIGGFRLPLDVKREDEEIYRKAEKLVVKVLDEYHRLYSQRPSEEILILVAYRLAVTMSKQNINQDLEPLAERIKNLDDELSMLLIQK